MSLSLQLTHAAAAEVLLDAVREPCTACQGASSKGLRSLTSACLSLLLTSKLSLAPNAVYVTGCVLVGFLLHPIHHVDPAWFAVLGAIVLCVCDKPMEVEKVIHVSVLAKLTLTSDSQGYAEGRAARMAD